MKKNVICIPTFNRPKILGDVCTCIADTISADKFDVYIYDSSPNTDSEQELAGLLEKNSHFFYCKIPDSVHSSEKLYHIYQDGHIQNDYNYLWVLPDYLFFSKEVIRTVLEAADQKWDMFMLDFYDPGKTGDRQCSDPNEIFREYGWSITQYGIMLLNCETVLKKADWGYLRARYLNKKCCNFSHVAMYFEMMLKIKDLKFYHFSVSREHVYISQHRRESEYFNEFLEIWGYRWYESIHALPEYYRNKDEVIKSACIHTGSLSEKSAVQLRINGVLNRKTFRKYRKIWNVISTVPAGRVWGIILLPLTVVKNTEEYGSIQAWIKHCIVEKRFEQFCRRHRKIYLYGAGKKAGRMAEYLSKRAIPFEGFVVTELKERMPDINGREVIEFARLKKSRDTGVILALNEENKKEVVLFLKRNRYRDYFQADIL